MDNRIREHARILVDWSARIDAGDDVVVAVEDGAHDLAVAVAEQLGDRGANLLSTYQSDELTRAYLQAHDGSFTETRRRTGTVRAGRQRAVLKGSRNTTETADVDATSGRRTRRLDRKSERLGWIPTGSTQIRQVIAAV